MTQRIYIAPDRVTVSKPGYDAVNPPAVDYKYLALDSRLTSNKPLEIGLIPTFVRGMTVNYTTTYAGIPGVDIVVYNTGSIAGVGNFIRYQRGIVIRDAGSVAYNRSHFYLGCYNNHFVVGEDVQYVGSSLTGGSYPAFYVLWQTW
ncbi:hypothetical protein IVB12_16065 [Bradyrhizobium sp. 179]|uniref:hypothetical protein n=1 Tax=Bradyrhizobium sp. 179 TaxID=2782648 RepID=UPI001FFAAC10|nr:hypothetical protein [Bradyrhizobium sp. 179]MCK1543433.1 hypothetical protein [Bradyrhizobium sp. 179]